MDAPVPQPAGSTVVPQDLRTWTHVVYALHAFSLLTGIVGAATVVGASPDAYFKRIVPSVLALRRIHRPTVARLLRRHFPAFLRQVYHLGVRIRGSRVLYWKALLRVLLKNPDALEAFGHDCFYYYHLNRHADSTEQLRHVSGRLRACLTWAIPSWLTGPRQTE